MTAHRHTPLVFPSVRKSDLKPRESRAALVSKVWRMFRGGNRVSGVIVTPAVSSYQFKHEGADL